MNATFPYEQLIASKLEQLPPLPEMADGIWLRITTELDRDLPTDDDDFGNDPGNGGEPVTDPAGTTPVSGWRGWTLLLILAGIAIFLLYRFNSNKIIPDDNILLPLDMPGLPSTTAEPILSNENQQVNAVSPTGTGTGKGPIVSDSASFLLPNQVVLPSPDSARTQQPVPPLNEITGQPDSARLDTVSTTTASEIKKDSSGGRKRPSGIKGISSDDYRIVPQKGQRDST
ncbi:hypothetical protein [Flavihumibacter sp. UBA7668]|uniref:hypothetical protein n=1 Tax=Flavihumibacter sp. UBA7668 TaxID=1946542 RepID=UPI0025BD6A60|nr:hypothetical protein [Flavihumibacter sp. UBA7668]